MAKKTNDDLVDTPPEDFHIWTSGSVQQQQNHCHNTWHVCTPQKINVEPEKQPFEKEYNLPNLHFGVPC